MTGPRIEELKVTFNWAPIMPGDANASYSRSPWPAKQGLLQPVPLGFPAFLHSIVFQVSCPDWDKMTSSVRKAHTSPSLWRPQLNTSVGMFEGFQRDLNWASMLQRNISLLDRCLIAHGTTKNSHSKLKKMKNCKLIAKTDKVGHIRLPRVPFRFGHICLCPYSASCVQLSYLFTEENWLDGRMHPKINLHTK